MAFAADLPKGRLVKRIALGVVVAIAAALSWLGSFDDIAREHVDSGLKRALVTFAIARTANAVISVLQETSVSVGVASAQPLQALDPINDMVEQFSALMLFASASFGIQRALISIGGLPIVSIALTLALIVWAAYAWREITPPPIVATLVALLLFARFAVPLAASASELAFRIALLGDYETATAQVDAATRGIDESVSHDQDKSRTWRERIMEKLKRLKNDAPEALASLKIQAEAAVIHVITLIAIFIVQTLILPLLFLWLFYRLLRACLRPSRWTLGPS